MAFDANQIGGIKGSQFFSVSANSEKAESSSNENSNSIFEIFLLKHKNLENEQKEKMMVLLQTGFSKMVS